MRFGHPSRNPRRNSGFGNVVPFRQPRRAWPLFRPLRRAAFSPIMLVLPLAAFTAVFLWGGGPPGWAASAPLPTLQDPETARFGQCWGRRGTNCVIDGDSLIYQGRQIRIADINAPEIGRPQCAEERARGERAEDRLQELMGEGPFSLKPVDRARDRYGRELFVITREGQSLGSVLVREGLAHEWHGSTRGWCG